MSNTSATDRARYDYAMEFVKLAYPKFKSIFTSDNKMPTIIATYALLDCAIQCLGTACIKESLDSDVPTKELIAEIQKDLPAKLKKLESLEGHPDNIIYVDFKNQGT